LKVPSMSLMDGVPVDLSIEGWPAVSQADSNCDFISMYDPAEIIPVIRLVQESILIISGVRYAHALPGGGGGGSDPCSVLELVVSGESLDKWTTSLSGSTATFTNPSGRSFTYDETTGEIN